ncbi:MAG: VPLPA-CTERM sorting domain-containing protein [Rhodobacteraceae bacterium]|nr:VPLPA-CTERM sorting domain-containing protein [Paracoccaceae bacterium]
MPQRLTKLARAAAAALALSALPAAATTISEGSQPGGDFSSSFSAPTSIGSGIDLITGTTGSTDRDFLVFTSMNPGAQTVTLSFSMPSASNPIGFAGGNVRYSFAPLPSATGGTSLGGFFLTSTASTQTLTLNLGASFAGTLYLGINTLLGTNIGYSISAPGNVPAAPVPLPASAALLAGALAGFGAMRARKGKRSAA